MSIYVDKGYVDRDDYLDQLSEDYDVDRHIVETMADLLGPDEDFDALLRELEDLSWMNN